MSRKSIVAAVSLLLAGAGFAGVSLAGYGPLAWFPAPVAVDLGDVGGGYRVVAVEGTAHYPVRVKLMVKPNMLSPLQERWIFPMFAKGDTMGREVQVLVSSLTPPDDLASFEDRKITAIVRRPTTRRLNKATLEAFRMVGYEFADDFLLLEDMAP